MPRLSTSVDRLSITVPPDWWLLPLEPAPRRAMVERLLAETAPGPRSDALAAMVENLSARASDAGAVMCAQGLLSPPGGRRAVSANVLVVVRPDSTSTRIDVAAEHLDATDPGSEVRVDLPCLPLAGPAARLRWRPPAPGGTGRTYCAEYWVPFPEDDRVAVVTCSAAPASPPESVIELLDALAATLVFVDGDGNAVIRQSGASSG